MKSNYGIEIHDGRRWILTNLVFKTLAKARRFGEWNYRSNIGTVWKVVRLKNKRQDKQIYMENYPLDN